MENFDLSVSIIAAVVFVLMVCLVVYGMRRRSRHKVRPETHEPLPREPAEEGAKIPPRPADVELAKGTPVTPVPVAKAPTMVEKLGRTREALKAKLEKLFLSAAQKELLAKEWEEIEQILLEADVGIATTTKLLNRVKERARTDGKEGLRALLKEECQHLLDGISHGPVDIRRTERPFVISIVGVNGVGKTTTIGKLAARFVQGGNTVLLGAADTFRAAAVEQLRIWAERTGSQFVGGREGGDPGAVAFDALKAGQARKVDVILLDTAGRLHTKVNLMDELKKIHRVMKKVIPEAPHETWLVLDGTIGQNSLQQAREFQKALDLSGVIITKLDGTAKGGAIFSIASELKLPIRFVGIGETAEDFVPFEPQSFVEAVLG